MTLTLSRGAAAAAALAGCLVLGACAPLLVGGAVGGVMMMADRRTSGAQVEDQAIELKAASRIREAIGERGHVNVTSYNRMALLTGEAASDADRAAAEQAVARVENVRSIVNELAVVGNSSFTSRSNDALITSRVKAAFVEAHDVPAAAFKVVTERAHVYLLGRVTEREATRAAELARTISGVQKVVRVVEIITEAELAAISHPPAQTTPPPTRP
jgi:osmotically-inducible protein OsmY